MVLTVLIYLFLFQPSMEEYNMLDNVFRSVDLLVSYYKDNFAYMNLDGIYGLRILEGQFAALLQNGKEYNISQKHRVKLKGLLELSSKIAETSIKHVQASDPEYFSKLSPLIERPMVFSGNYHRVNQYLRWSRSDLKAKGFDEVFSDKCMTELMQKRAGRSVCEVSEECLTGIFETGHQEYIILHQILYIMLARQHSCTHVLDSYLSSLGYTGDLAGIMEEFCSNTLFEVVDLLNELTDNLIPDIYQDLFLEQQFVCPSQGYMEFLHGDWLKQILSWQNPSGCYGSMADKYPTLVHSRGVSKATILPQKPSHDVVVQLGDNGQKLVYKRHNVTKEEELVIKQPLNYPFIGEPDPGMRFGQRKLLEERVLNDGCLCHKTAVAAGALSQYIKFLVNPGPREYIQQVSITGRNYLLYKTWYSMVFNSNDTQDSQQQKQQMDLLDKHVDKNRQLKNYRLGRGPADDKEEVYQNQVNVPQPMYLGEKYEEEGYEENERDNADPHGYYDDSDEEPAADVRQGEGDVGGKVGNPNVWGNGLRKANVKLSNDGPRQQRSPYYGDDDKLREMIDPNKLKQEKNDDDNPGYGYYDEPEKPRHEGESASRKLVLGREEKVLAGQLGEIGTHSSNMTLIQSYFILLVAMVGLLAFMYRFVRKRRIVIKYR